MRVKDTKEIHLPNPSNTADKRTRFHDGLLAEPDELWEGLPPLVPDEQRRLRPTPADIQVRVHTDYHETHAAVLNAKTNRIKREVATRGLAA